MAHSAVSQSHGLCVLRYITGHQREIDDDKNGNNDDDAHGKTSGGFQIKGPS